MKKKTITLKLDASDWKATRWVINCFQAAVHDAYSEGAPRRLEADKLTEELHEQARRQVSAMGEDYDT